MTAAPAVKVCVACERTLELSEFYRVHRDGEKLQARCKPCDNARRKGRHPHGTLGQNITRMIVTRNADGSLTMTRRAS